MKSIPRIMAHLLLVALLVAQIAGCHSMRTIEASPESVRQGISDGSLLEKGDWARVYLTSGESIYLQVDRVSEHKIFGHEHAMPEGDQKDDPTAYRPWTEVVVPISEVERLERRGFSAGKTAAAGGLGVLWVIILIGIAAAGLGGGI